MATEVYPDGMHAHADILLSRSDKWAVSTVHATGLVYYTFTSSRVDKHGKPIYYHTVRGNGFCDCPGYAWRRTCSHSIAVKREAEIAREAAVRKPRPSYDQMMDAQLDERTQTVSAF